MKGFWKFFDRLSDAMAALAGVLLVLISAAMCYTIFMRFIFRQTTIWIIPMSEYALLWIVFLGTTWLLRRGRTCYDRYRLRSSQRENQALSQLYHVCHRRAYLCWPGLFLGVSTCMNVFWAG